jgi:hypothetical protein
MTCEEARNNAVDCSIATESCWLERRDCVKQSTPKIQLNRAILVCDSLNKSSQVASATGLSIIAFTLWRTSEIARLSGKDRHDSKRKETALHADLSDWHFASKQNYFLPDSFFHSSVHC